METKTIYWNELSELTKLVLRELSEQTKLVLMPTVKITHSIENGCSILMFEPEKKETFLVGEIVEYKELPGTYTFAKAEDILLDVYNKTTLEEKDTFLLTQNKMIGDNGEVVRWKPKYKKEYFSPFFGFGERFIKLEWCDSEVDNNRYNALLVNSTPELAIEAHEKMLNSLK